MQKFNSLSHSRYYCKYHIVFVPKFMKMALMQIFLERFLKNMLTALL